LFNWLSERTLERDPDTEFEGMPFSAFFLKSQFMYLADDVGTVQVERLVVDEEKLLDTIPRNSQEAIVSCLSLHWVNDLPGEQFL
jgi:hypothetical protein